MSITAVGRCPQCQAVVNVHWPSCLVCKATLPTLPEPHKQPESSLPTVAIGSVITWHGADGRQRGPAAVDLVHTDSNGTRWAFVTTPEGWAAVNLKFASITNATNQ